MSPKPHSPLPPDDEADAATTTPADFGFDLDREPYSREPVCTFLTCRVAGAGYSEELPEIIDKLSPGTRVYLGRDYGNIHDRAAIAVGYIHDEVRITEANNNNDFNNFDCVIGYIPRDLNTQLAALMDMGWEQLFDCFISQNDATRPLQTRLQITVQLRNRHYHSLLDESQRLRLWAVDAKTFHEISASIGRRGVFCTRWGGFPPELHRGLPRPGQRVAVIHFNNDANPAIATIYLMMTIAVGNECAPFLDNIDDLHMVDDCTCYALTNIHGPVNIHHKKLTFLNGEPVCTDQPDCLLSPTATATLRSLLA
jgi:hypothetical protein